MYAIRSYYVVNKHPTSSTFTLKVELPAGWLAVSQGAGPDAETEGRRIRVRWREEQPQDRNNFV